ncbi:MAG: amino acid ABC transporter permease [Christensenellales bacterium]
MAKHVPMYWEAAKLTLSLAFWGILCSLILGFACAMALYYKVKGLRHVVTAYIELSRNTPLLIQLFFLYYGLTRVGLKLSSTACAVIGLTFLGGSYMAEAFRSGLEAVQRGQIESGLSLGLKKGQLMWYVILPQALAVSMPALGANLIFLIKETSMFSAVALADLMFVAKDLIGMYYKTNEALLMLVVAYLIILLPLSLLMSWLERRVRHAGFGR